MTNDYQQGGKQRTQGSLFTIQALTPIAHNLIVHYYERIDDAIVYGVFKKNTSDFDLFIDRILEYLQRTAWDYKTILAAP